LRTDLSRLGLRQPFVKRRSVAPLGGWLSLTPSDATVSPDRQFSSVINHGDHINRSFCQVVSRTGVNPEGRDLNP
jgi:hypothetical protein